MSIRAFGFLDTSQFTATLLTRHKKQLDTDGYLVLRAKDVETDSFADRDIIKEWKAARGLIARIRNNAVPFMDGIPFEFGEIFVDKIGVMDARQWRKEDDEHLVRVRIGLTPSPGSMVYSGNTGLNLLVGAVVVQEHRVPFCEINVGPVACLHLVVDILRMDE